MTGRRAANRIRGPHSALTDFLAANNISAQQIRDSYQQRLQQSEQANTTTPAADSNGSPAAADGVTEEAESSRAAEAQLQAEAEAEAEEAERAIERSTKRRRASAKDATALKKGKGKEKEKNKKKAAKKKNESDDSGDSDYDDLGQNMYQKAKPLPGQLENCEVCGKRFTVTPYSKAGMDGGLLCTPCGKQLATDTKAEAKAKKPVINRKRRKIESDKLDGIVTGGAKTLAQLCIEKVAQHHTDIDEFGDLPDALIGRLSEIFSKKRVLTSRTMQLFLQSDMDTVALHDCSYLESEDYEQIFAIVPKLKKLVLCNVCQFKDPTMDYMVEKAQNLQHLQLYGANLVSDEKWIQLFQARGKKLQTLKLQWLDASFDDNAVREMTLCCPNLQRIKFERCRKLTAESVDYISQLSGLKHLSLQLSHDVPNEHLVNLVSCVGDQLETLSLERFLDANDTFLEALKTHCQVLEKLRFTENDYCTDQGYTTLFNEWTNTPLRFIDLNSTRDVDNSNPEGPEDAVGLASNGFIALMQHSGKKLEHLDISSCRHITLSAFLDVFDGQKQYPCLREINISFCGVVDTTVIVGIFKSCPSLKKVVAFGCFGVADVVVPAGIVLIGVPKAQDAIEQYGDSLLNVDQALGKMLLQVGA